MLKKKFSLLAWQEAQDSKYPLWKYVSRHQGTDTKLKGGGNVLWTCSFFNNHFKRTYFWVKGHFLGTLCGLGPCQGVSASKWRELEREANVGEGIVAAASRKTKNEDPLPFLNHLANTHLGVGVQQQERGLQWVQWTRYYNKRGIWVGSYHWVFFFYFNFISFNVA